jgi:hypothetical protein
MKRLALAVPVALALMLAATLTAHGGIAAAPSCTAGKPHPAVMSAKRLHMWNQPIGYGGGDLKNGPIWDEDYPTRPGQGETMVIRGHDVTPVPGYGKHGPFYRLPLMKSGDLVTITRCGVAYTYRFVRSFTHWQCATKKVSMDPRRYTGELECFLNDAPIKQWRGEELYLRCCWPRHTDYKFFYVRLVLVKTQPSS